MKNIHSGICPVCDAKLRINRLACPQCKAEYPTDKEISPFELLNEEQKVFLTTFLTCEGNIKAIETALDISYPTVKKRCSELLVALGLKEKQIIEIATENIDMSIFGTLNRNSKKASDIIKNKLYDNNGHAIIPLQKGEPCRIAISENGNAFVSDKLPNQTVDFCVFDIITEFLKANHGKAPKGMGRNDRVGYGKNLPFDWEAYRLQMRCRFLRWQCGKAPLFARE